MIFFVIELSHQQNKTEKLKGLLQFLNQTVDNRRVIVADSLSDMFTWIYSLYVFYPDMKISNGGSMSPRLDLIHCLSLKLKLNIKSSIEAEVVKFSDYVTFNIYMRLFMDAQGYPLKSYVLYQDNQSLILI